MREMNPNRRRRLRKSQAKASKKARQEEAKSLAKVRIRSWKAAESSIIGLFKKMSAVVPKAKLPLELPESLREKLHPKLRAEADKFWRLLIAGLLKAREEANDANVTG